MSVLRSINLILSILFFLCYSYQLVYLLIPHIKRPRPHGPETLHRIAVLIAARNEQAVIAKLIESIKAQDYPRELVSIFVAADNCTDGTASAARRAGAAVYERFDSAHVGKGYALDFLLRRIRAERGDVYDAYLILDADNLLSPGFISAMNRTFSDGYCAVTCYRNSKNFADNWISAGYALWFLREARYLNYARVLSGHSAAVSGTGFMVSRELLEADGGWPFHLLTEDIEFTVHTVVNGGKIGIAMDAELFDEQPVTFAQSWRQRERWARGYFQVFGRYGGELIRSALHGSFSAFDMTMSILPAFIMVFAGFAVNSAALLLALLSGASVVPALLSALESLAWQYSFMLFIGAVTAIAERRSIRASSGKKLLYTLTFPLFMFTYIPISVSAMLHKVAWKPIEHSRAISIGDLDRAA